MATREPPPLITECPNCHTRFRVGESQLQIAHGRVRCGACLAVFAGVDHLLLDDTVEIPELPSETNMLESVLAELAEEDGLANSASVSDGQPGGSAHGITAARAYELEALADKRGESPENELPNGLQAADTTEQPVIERGLAEEADWTSVAVDTQEFPPRGGRERSNSEPSVIAATEAAPKAPPRASIEDALNDEEALRWWLEDELPGNDGVLATGDDEDSMVMQLSELDAVRDDEFDLQELIATPESESKGQLEALFRELREDGESDAGDAGDPVDEVIAQEAVQPSSERALRQVVADLKADSDAAGVDAPLEAAIEAAVQAPVPVMAAASAAATESTPVKAPESAVDSVTESSPSERAAAELHEAMDEVEPLVTRAMASGVLAASANKVAATEREAAAEQAMEREFAARKAPTPPTEEADASNSERLASGRGIALVEPPPARQAAQQADPHSWNAESFPATPAESVANITSEMAAAGKPQPAKSVNAQTAASVLTVAKATLERWLSNPNALRVGTVLASVLFVGQVMFWQFDDWAKSPTLRPVYAGLCSVVGCELPLRRSVQDMQSRKLAVRSHPEKSDKLLVDALIINEAEFAQPFPLIVLQFMDLNQQVVGSYTLEPSSYLDGELAGSKALMAVRTPVHIDIEIADPGPTAVNYQLQFR